MKRGYLALILHAHLPFVRHPEKIDSLEERWLFEAITESYIPLIRILNKLIDQKIEFKLTLSLSPPLISMLRDPLLQQRYLYHINNLRELAQMEIKRTNELPEYHSLAHMYHDFFNEIHKTYLFYNRDLISAFKKLGKSGKLEIITSAATHGYLPLMVNQHKIAKAQIQIALDFFEEHFGYRPEGIWLPECGYYPGLDHILQELKIKYFIVDTHGILFATPRPRYAIYAPVTCPESGVVAFGRDLESSKEVWSAREGYPGDFDYREFYRDIGYELDLDYLKKFLPCKVRTDTGIKYWRISGKNEPKQPYIPKWAREKALIHADNFIFNRERQIERLSLNMDRPPIIVSPYDAELFGHWWFEGPQWLDFLLRKLAKNNTIKLTTPRDYLQSFSNLQPSLPSMSSWGQGGYNQVWLNENNSWIYEHLYKAARKLIKFANREPNPSPLKRSALNQALRELLLAQSSDWAFIMKTGTTVEYARFRTLKHLSNLEKLLREIEEQKIDDAWLARLEQQNNIFPCLDYKIII